MGIFDFLKKKKKPKEEKKAVKPKKAEKPKKEVKKVPKVKVEKKPKPEIKKPIPSVGPAVPRTRKKKKFKQTFRILKEPHVTEKATDLVDKNQYVFKVWPRSNKIEIKKAVESLYNVDVLEVKIIKVGPKKRRMGRVEGWRKGYKKAIVKVKAGQKIEVLPR